jgi:hypothetical protein
VDTEQAGRETLNRRVKEDAPQVPAARIVAQQLSGELKHANNPPATR